MKLIRLLLALILLSIAVITQASAKDGGSFVPYVDSKGNISLPLDFRSGWVHLGTWVVTSRAAAGTDFNHAAPDSGIHHVYTQPPSLKAYKKDGKWSDGAVLIMEVRAIKWDDLPTGHVISEGEPLEWFVMIKDTKRRFKGNTNWGDGWGWALFKVNNPKKNVSTDYKKDCIGCHEPAKDTDWVYIQGYPTLK
jgi:Cytochrome P460